MLTFAPRRRRKAASLAISPCTEASTSALRSSSITATRKSRSSRRLSRGRARRQPRPSTASGPPIASSATARSPAPRAIGPIAEMSDGATLPGSAWPRGLAIPQVGLCP